MTEHRLPERTQVLVIGSGAGGATTARVLAEEGIEVTLVEEGPDIDTASIDSNSIDAIELWLWTDKVCFDALASL